MSNSDTQEASSYILPVVAVFLSVSMSGFFSQLSISNIVYEGFDDPGYLLAILTIAVLYFFVFYAISRILALRIISAYLLGGVLVSSIIIILIGMSDIRGIFVKILLWLLMAFLFFVLWRIGFEKMQYWYFLILIPLLFSTAYSSAYSSKLLISDHDVWLESKDYDENGFVHATLFVRMKAHRCDANNIRAKIICSNQVFLDKDECVLLGIDTLEENKERVVKWNIIFEGIHAHSFFLYLVSSGGVFNKRITIYHEDDWWKATIDDVGYLENLLIFLKNNPLLPF